MASGQLENVEPTHLTSTPAWMEIARAELGTRETSAKADKYFEVCGAKPDPTGTPWCAYFVGYCLEIAKYSSTKKANARSYLSWGNERTGSSQVGDIIVLWRGTKNDGITGHVGFYVREDKDFVYLIGGNQGDAVTEAKFYKSKILGIRYPRTMWSSKTSWTGGGVSTTGVGTIVDGFSAPTVEQAVEAKSLFEQIMQYFPNYKIMLGVAITLLGLYIIYNRKKDNTEKGV